MVEDIAKSTETFFSRLQLIELKGEAAVTSLDEALTDWRTSYAVLDAKISTYFPFSDELRREWRQVGAELWTTYFLLANDTPAKREALFKESVLLFGDDPEVHLWGHQARRRHRPDLVPIPRQRVRRAQARGVRDVRRPHPAEAARHVPLSQREGASPSPQRACASQIVTAAEAIRVASRAEVGWRSPPVVDSIGYGAEDGARTHNLLFTKQLLCH